MTSKQDLRSALLRSLRSSMTPPQLKANDIAQSDVASIWLSSLQIKSENFNITKREFFDAVLLRYVWQLQKLHAECVCRSKFNVDHALSCKTGGFVALESMGPGGRT